MKSPQEILQFWFNELTPHARFANDAELDHKIRDRFLSLHADVVAGKAESWRKTPEGRLAEIIVLDQFSRNMFRNLAKAFSFDDMALKLAQECVALGDDQKLSSEQQAFVYMPYMHSEDRQIHEQAVVLFSQKGLEFNLKYEMMHKKIIDRFGRYPHRNQALQRASTAEELEFLKEEGSSF